METSQVPNFQQFCEQELQLRHRLNGMHDGRHAPQISAGTVAEVICFMGALGLGSLLQCDQQLRTTVGQQCAEHIYIDRSVKDFYNAKAWRDFLITQL